MSYLGRSAKLSLKAQEKVSFLATAGQTVKTGLSYTPSFVEVYVNGVLLTDTTDFTATNGNSITFTVALTLNDEVTVISLKTFTVADHYTKSDADTLLAAKATNTALATKLPLAGGTMTGALVINSPNEATGGRALQLRQGDATSFGIDMGISQVTGHLNISRVNSGTATHMMTLARDSGNVGIGVTPEAWQSGLDVLQLGLGGSIAANKTNPSRTYVNANIYQNSSNVASYINTDEASQYFQNGGTHIFNVAPSGTADAAISWTTAMKITNDGVITVGTDTPFSSGVVCFDGGNNAYVPLVTRVTQTANATQIGFVNGNGNIGSITSNGSSTAYNTSSDYRLKTDVQPMTGAADRVKLLKPCNFEWIVDGTRVDGFIAHEAQEVVPEAVSGTKDAMRDEEYEVNPATDTEAAVMGTRSVPDMQGIDQSKLVPLLTATIQELIARIEALEAGE